MQRDEVEILRWRKTLYQAGPFQVVEATNLSGEPLVAVGENLSWGEEGLFLASLKEERHPRYGRRYRVVRSRPVDVQEVILTAQEKLRRHIPGALSLLEEAGHTAFPLHALAHLLGLPQETLARELEKTPGVRVAYGRVGFERNYLLERSLLASLEARKKEGGYPLRPPPKHGLSETQAEIFRVFAKGKVAALTGGPGTGKSYTVAALLKSPSLEGKTVGLAAPTGKAAKRMEELSGEKALTVHRFLGYYVDDKGEERFRHNAHNPVPHHLVIVDEASMLDLPTFHALVDGVSGLSQLLLVGDPNQLPPVGPGEPFRDLLPLLPAVRLKEVRRQGKDNPIVTAANMVLEGLEPALPESPEYALRVMEANPTELARMAVEVYLEAVRRGEKAVVLTATNTGPLGVYALNQMVQKALNPKGPSVPIGGGLEARVGDPVVSTRNDYLLELMNGEVLEVVSVDPKGPGLGAVTSEGRPYYVDGPALNHLLLGYALSVHRSQGSEWPTVIVALHHYQDPLLSRELLYTALTRAKKRAVLLLTEEALYTCRARRSSGRHTWLKVFTRAS